MNDNLNEIIEDETNEVEATVETNVEANGDLSGFSDINEVNNEEDTTEDTTEDHSPDVQEPTQRIMFGDRAEEMGLTTVAPGTFYYIDQFSEIMYKNVKPVDDVEDVVTPDIPHLAIFTKAIEEDAEWKYQNFISDAYKFLGNATLIDQIKDSIGAIGNAELEERHFSAPNFAEMRHEIVIRNANTIPAVGVVYPMMYITNSYNGTGASTIVFGMQIAESDAVSHFCTEKFGKIKQIHLTGSSTELEAAFGEYVTIFGNNITDMVNENFNNQITETDMMKVLDIIETKAGKKRRELISNELPVIEESADGVAIPWNMTSWQLFLTLTRFTSVETNLNAKRIMENIAERVLIVPEQMSDALKVING